MQRLKQAQHRRECFAIRVLLIRRDFERAAAHIAANLGRKSRDNVFEARRDRGRIATEKSLEGDHRWIEHGVTLLEEIDELADFGFVRREFASALCDLDEP